MQVRGSDSTERRVGVAARDRLQRVAGAGRVPGRRLLPARAALRRRGRLQRPHRRDQLFVVIHHFLLCHTSVITLNEDNVELICS